jgi:hypothetical protein
MTTRQTTNERISIYTYKVKVREKNSSSLRLETLTEMNLTYYLKLILF